MSSRDAYAAFFEDQADRELHLILRFDHAGHEFHSRRDERTKAVANLRGADDIEVFVLSENAASVKLRNASLHWHQAGRKEWKTDVVAGGTDDDVELFRGVVHKINCFPVEAGDIGTGTNAALFHVVEKFAIDGWMCLENAVIGFGK